MTNVKQISVAFLFASVLLVPGGAFANNMPNEIPQDANDFYYDGNKIEPDWEDLPNPMQAHIDTNETTLQQAHSTVTNYMIMANDSELDPENYSGPEIPFVMVYIADDRLVVGLDPLLAHPDYAIDPEIIQEILGIDLPVEVQYVSLEDDMSKSREKRIIKQYQRECMPVLPTKVNTCKRLDSLIDKNDIVVPGRDSPADNKPSVSNFKAKLSSSNVKLTWDASNTSKIKSYYLYASENYGSYKYKGKISKNSESYTVSGLQDGKTYQFKLSMYYKDGSKNKVQSYYSNKIKTPTAEPPYVPPTLTNVKAKQSGDDIKVTWKSTEQSKIKYYLIYKYVDDRRIGVSYAAKTATSFTLSDADEGKEYKFKVFMYYKNENNRNSVISAWSNAVEIPRPIPVDRTAPVVTVPSDMTVSSDSENGVVVTYTASARDNTDGVITPVCTRVSGANFAVGTTVVTCTATDVAGNVGSDSFVVTVTYDPPIVVQPTPTESEVTMYYGGTQHNLHFTNDTGRFYAPATITIGATTTENVVGMVTSGHAMQLDAGETLRYYSLGNETKHRLDAVVPHVVNSGSVDAAFTPILDDSIAVNSTQIQAHDGSLIDVVHGSLSDVAINQPLSVYGIYTNNDQGMLLFNNVTVDWRYDDRPNVVFTNMGVGNYGTIGGDSGAPILHEKDGKSYLVGVNKGTLCAFDPEFPHGIEVDVTGTDKCPSGNTDGNYYKIFSSWENVKRALSLQ